MNDEKITTVDMFQLLREDIKIFGGTSLGGYATAQGKI